MFSSDETFYHFGDESAKFTPKIESKGSVA